MLFGLITLLVQYVGLFMLGFHSGLLLGLVGLCVADQVAEAGTPESPWTAVGILIVSGLALALLNLCCQVSPRRAIAIYIWLPSKNEVPLVSGQQGSYT